MSFELPRDVIFPVHSVTVRLDPDPHPFGSGERDAIRANWERAKAANPALFDGEVVLLSRLSYGGGELAGLCHVVRYSTFLYWRATRPTDKAEHAYAHAMPVTSDNALVAIRMGPDTVTAGLVYFAAGSFEPVDFPDGIADLDFNMRREVMEETGHEQGGLPHDEAVHPLSKESGTVIFRRYRFAETADELAERIRRHVAAEENPEIEGPVIIRGPGDLPDGLAPQMPALIEWHFANPMPASAAAARA